MPLLKKSSDKALKSNIRTEMEANPDKADRKQNLAIAFSVQRQAKKKKKASGGTVESGSRDMNYAEGGEVESAANEKRPNPKNTYRDTKNVSENSGNKPLRESNWTDNPTVKQSQGAGMKVTKIKHPKMAKSDVLQVRLRDEEDDLQNSAGTNEGPQQQPAKWHDEEDADGSGTEPHKQTAISTGRQVMAEGGEADDSEYPHEGKVIKKHGEHFAQTKEGALHHIPDAEHGKSLLGQTVRFGVNEMDDASLHPKHKKMAKGGKVEASDYDDTDPNASTDSDMHLTPSEDEAAEMARHQEEEYQRQTSGNPDMAKPHNQSQSEAYNNEEDSEDPITSGSRAGSAFANGGYAEDVEDSEPQPEADDEEHDSIAAAVMARMERAKAKIASGSRDMDMAARFAQGGEITSERGHILSEGATDSDDSDQADLRRNAEEDQNHEDQLSFRALEKENYSESEGLHDLTYDTDDAGMGDSEEDDTSDPHNMVDSIRRKIKAKKQLSEV